MERVRQSVEAMGAAGTEEAALLLARNEAFESFRRSYRKNETIEANKVQLKDNYERAKKLGEQVNASRTRINSVKTQLEVCRQKRAVAELTGGAGGAPGAEEESLKAQLEEEKRQYKDGFAQLRELKSEIEHLQHLLEQSRRRLQQDFEKWYAAGPQPVGEVGQAAADVKTAWPSPARGANPARSPQPRGAPPLTGNNEVDQEIMAFYKARESLVQNRMAKAP